MKKTKKNPKTNDKTQPLLLNSFEPSEIAFTTFIPYLGKGVHSSRAAVLGNESKHVKRGHFSSNHFKWPTITTSKRKF